MNTAIGATVFIVNLVLLRLSLRGKKVNWAWLALWATFNVVGCLILFIRGNL